MDVTLTVDTIGEIPLRLNDSLAAAAVLRRLAGEATAGRVHRAEPLPPAGSNGPPYALVQFTLQANGALRSLKHEGAAKIVRGSVCIIGSADDVFISLARNNEHNGWETGMIVVGSVPEPQLTELVEKAILSKPYHDFTHPQYGTVMSMLDKEMPCVLRAGR